MPPLRALLRDARRLFVGLRFGGADWPLVIGEVQPAGDPMSISTHAGLSAPPVRAASPGVFRSNSDGAVPVSLKSLAAGVGQADSCARTVASVSVVPECRPLAVEYAAEPLLFASPAVGVGLADPNFTATASGIPAPLPLLCFALSDAALASHSAGASASFGIVADGVGHAFTCAANDAINPPLACAVAPGAPFASCACAVAHVPRDDEDALATVRSAHIGGAEIEPERIIPRFGKAPENDIKPSKSESRDVLHDDDAGSKRASDSQELEP